MFLGRNYPYKNIDPTNPNFSGYLTRTFDKDYLTKKTIDLIVEDITGSPGGVRLLDYMVHNGKKLYLLKKFLPAAGFYHFVRRGTNGLGTQQRIGDLVVFHRTKPDL